MPDNPQLRRRYLLARRGCAIAVRACAIATMILAGLAIFGWVADFPDLHSVRAESIAMKPNAALAFLLASAALLVFTIRPTAARARALRPVAQSLGVVVALLGAATGAQDLLGVDFGIDQAVLQDTSSHYNVARGRMSPYTAFGALCLGISLAALPVHRLRVAALACAGCVVLIGLLVFIGYAWGAPELVSDRWVRPVALNSAFAFLLLGLGTVLAICRFSRGTGSMRILLDTVGLRVLASFVGAVIVLVGMGGLMYDALADYAAQGRALLERKVFSGQLARLHAEAAAAALAQKDYLITGQPSALEVWTSWSAHVEARRATVAAGAQGLSAREQAGVTELDKAVGALLRSLEQEIDVYRREGSSAAQARVLSGASVKAMGNVRQALIRIEDMDRAQEESREALVAASREKALLVALATLAALVAALAVMLLSIRREITARASTERALRRRSSDVAAANNFLESLVQNIPSMVFVKEAAGLRFVRLNRVAERMLGLRQQDVVGKTDLDLLPREQAEFFIAMDRHVLEKGDVVDIPEEELGSAAGRRLLHTRKIPLYDAAGRATHIIGISEDVTEVREQDRQIRRLNEELAAQVARVEHIDRAKSAFLAAMSHEIRTPMNGMLGLVELLLLNATDDRTRQRLALVHESGQSLLRIVDDILDFSKIEADKMELREEVADLAALVRDICNIHSPSAAAKGLVLTTTIDARLSRAAWFDPLRLRQILNNFVSNAVKFTAKGGVAIDAAVLADDGDAQRVRLVVTDTGPGIDPAAQQRLFTPFVQLETGEGRAAGGTGLGLVIARRLAELMGGTVEIDSAPGRGTRLSVSLDLRKAGADSLPLPSDDRIQRLRELTAATRRAPSAEEAAAERTLVLVIDDHPVNLLLMEEQLSILGYACETAADGIEGLQQWETGRFALVITDCQMPRMDGYALARRIRELEAERGLRRTPIIGCTALALPEELGRCEAAGMDDCVTKPLELSRMLVKLNTWLPIPGATPLPAASVAAGAAVPPAGPSAIDTAFLTQSWGSDPVVIRSVLESYAHSAVQDSAALRAAIAQGDRHAVSNAAHRFGGASKVVGAHALAQACVLLDAAARNEDEPMLARARDAFEAEYARVMRALSDPALPAGAGLEAGAR